MDSVYENFDIAPRLKKKRFVYALMILTTFFTFLVFVVNLLTFLEFYYFLRFLQRDQQIKNLTHTLSHIDIESMIEIFKEVKVNDIKSILGKITETDVEGFFFGIENCIMSKCSSYHGK